MGRKIKVCLLTFLLTAAMAAGFVFADGEVFLTWDEYVEANNITSWNYNDQARIIKEVADYAVQLYEAGDKDTAYEYAKATYWGYYEVSGFERNTMNYISGSRVSEVELAFTTLRKAVKKDQGLDAVKDAAKALTDLLAEDGAILSPEGAVMGGETSGGGENSYESELGYFLTWDEYKDAYGIANWNYNDMARAIGGVAYHALDLYEAGEMDEAYEFAKATYWGYYETSGFERNTMNYISGSRVSEVELAFTTLRKAVKKDMGADAIKAAADDLMALLETDAKILSPEGAVANVGGSQSAEEGDVSTGTSIGSSVAVFLGAFLIILREGLEAILIVGAIIAYLIKTGNEKSVRAVYIGSVLGIVCSFIMAGVLNWLISRSAEYHMSQEVIEGIAALTAVVVLIWVSNWMLSKSETEAWTNYIKKQAAANTGKGSIIALAFTAWLAVFREGAEVILFYQPMLAEDKPKMVWAGFLTGCAVLVVVYLAIRYLSIKLPLKPFFMGTSILMAAMSISFLGAGIKELIEGAVFEEIESVDLSWVSSSPSWLSWIPYNDTLDVLGIYPLMGTIIPQLILLAITILTFVLHIRKTKKEAAEREAEKTANA